MDLSPLEEGRLALEEGNTFAVAAGDPPVSGRREEDLTESRFVRADLSAGLEVDDVRVRLAFALDELHRCGALGAVTRDRVCQARVEPKHLHR
jgi:hypothetical protein